MIIDLIIGIIEAGISSAKTDRLSNWKQRIFSFILILAVLIALVILSMLFFSQ